jgi:hypothetical protein
MRRLALSTVAVAGLLAATNAQATDYTIDSTKTQVEWITVLANAVLGQAYQFTVLNPETIWSAGDPPNRESTAAGIDPRYYGTHTQDGYTGLFGSLVGWTNVTGYFTIGLGTTLSNLAGEVKVGYWDSTYGDNSGTQQVSVTAVPGPLAGAGLVPAALLLGGAWLGRRRWSRT